MLLRVELELLLDQAACSVSMSFFRLMHAIAWLFRPASLCETASFRIDCTWRSRCAERFSIRSLESAMRWRTSLPSQSEVAGWVGG